MSEVAVPSSERHGGTTRWWSTPETVAAMLAAVVSLIFILESIRTDAIGSVNASAPTFAVDSAVLLVPHLLIFTLLAAGFRRLGGIAGVIVGVIVLPVTLLIGLAALLDHTSSSWETLALAQLVLIVCGIRHVRGVRRGGSAVPESRAQWTAGLAIGGGVAATLYGLLLSIDAPTRALVRARQSTVTYHSQERLAHERFYRVAACLQLHGARDPRSGFPDDLAELSADPRCAPHTSTTADGYVLDYAPAPRTVTGRRTAFRLVTHPAVLTDSSVSLSTDESGLLHRRRGRDEARATWSMFGTPITVITELGDCIERFRGTDPEHPTRYPQSLAELARKVGCSGMKLARADSSTGIIRRQFLYRVRYTPPAAARDPRVNGGFTLLLEPVRDTTGFAEVGALRSYLVDAQGAIHVTASPRPADEYDPVLPDCTSGRAWGSECRYFRLRQRWGVGPELPELSPSISSVKGKVVAGESVSYWPHFRPTLAQDSVVSYSFAWRAEDADSVVRVGTRASVVESLSGNTLIFRLKHVYHDTGSVVIRFSVLTRGGERYARLDTVRVVQTLR